MRNPRRGTALLLAVLGLAGCGIQETDVIEAGGPARIQVFPAREGRMLLFLRSPDGELMPVARQVDEPVPPEYANSGAGTRKTTDPPVSTAKTIAALFNGPVDVERLSGLTSGLPTLAPGGSVQVLPSQAEGEDGVEIIVPAPVSAFDETGLRQLVCTAAYNEDPEGVTSVRVRGTDRRVGPFQCDADTGAGSEGRKGLPGSTPPGSAGGTSGAEPPARP